MVAHLPARFRVLHIHNRVLAKRLRLSTSHQVEKLLELPVARILQTGCILLVERIQNWLELKQGLALFEKQELLRERLARRQVALLQTDQTASQHWPLLLCY